ncbi:YveK family protein [Paenibacillus methanolicus]|uniref:Capsular polysaccharide biosynthesis protein n=1 Tax=Paenibacillus methanolicus TaxID=582686 RepID=A0A5S5BPM7_9BACL|nr:Wzz/FepE/Etk N-terminal domain-containing protein [Paenibacillus methanolicus]TYP69135.1 capsular polysaccharide biosynthesis protein [Paenibacillus methanolicus]
MEFERLVYAIIRKIWLVVLLALVGGVAAGSLSVATAQPVYQTETTLFVMKRSSSMLSGEAITYNDIALSRELIKDFSQILLSARVIEPAVREVGIEGVTSADVSVATGIRLIEESNVMSIVITWPDATEAVNIANAVGRSFASVIGSLTNDTNSVGIIDEARVAYSVPPGHAKMVIFGIMAGLLLSLAYIYVREIFDSTIRSAKEIERGLELKVIGIIPEYNIS